MKLGCILFAFLMLSMQSLAGQEFVWEAIYPSGTPTDMTMDANGNVYVTGSSGSHIRTEKYASSDGEQIWATTWLSHNGYGDAICLDDSANVYVIGPIYVDGQQYLMALKYDSAGNQEWSNNEYLQATTEHRWHIAVDNLGGMYVATDSLDLCLLIKFDAENGDTVWTRTKELDGNDGTWRAIDIDDRGSICVAGTEQQGDDPEHLWTAKYTPNGYETWVAQYNPVNQYGDTAQTGADGIDIDYMGNVYVGGTSDSAGQSCGLIVKYNGNGVLQWTRHLVAEHTTGCEDIKVCPTSGVSYITGEFHTTSDNKDLYVHAVDTDGDSLWISTYGGELHDKGWELGMTENCVYACGKYTNAGSDEDILIVCFEPDNGALKWAEVIERTGADYCYDIAVQMIGGGDEHTAVTSASEGWRTLKYYYCETVDTMALAYNGNRHLVRTPNTEELHLVYTRGGEVVYRYSSNGGIDWDLPVTIGEGGFPAITLDSDNLLSVAWTDEEGGLWHKRKTSVDDWSDIYHIDDPTGPSDRHLNSPPAIAIDPISRPNTVHILVTRSGLIPTYKHEYSHTLADFAFPINDPSQGWFNIIEERLGPLDPPLRTSPSIARCVVDNSFHATWQRMDTVCYATKPANGPWVNWGWQFDSVGLQSAHPFAETDGDSIYVVWQRLDPSTQKEEVYRARRYLPWNYFLWGNFSRSSNLASFYPVNAAGFFTAYAEEQATSSPYDIYYKIKPNDDRIIISNTSANSLYPQSAARFLVDKKYLYTAWLDGDDTPYEIKFRRIQHQEPEGKAYLSSANGQNLPSPYLIARDSFINEWQIPVDIGNMATTYQFPLEPGYAYKAKAVVYHEGSGPWSGRIKIDNNLQFSVIYNGNVPETLECWIPPVLYEDSVLTVSFNRIAGDFAAIGPIYIYRYEYEGTGGGPMSHQDQPMHSTLITVFPNPFTNRLNIAYQVANQNKAKLKVYDVTGRLVKQFTLPSCKSLNQIIWDGVDDQGRAVPQGVYFLRVDNPDSGDMICQKVLKVR